MRSVRQIQRWRGAGWSYHKIAGALTRREVPTKTGGRWYAATVRYIPLNSLYGGTGNRAGC